MDKAVAKILVYHLTCPAVAEGEERPEFTMDSVTDRGEVFICPRCQDSVVLQLWVARAEPIAPEVLQ